MSQQLDVDPSTDDEHRELRDRILETSMTILREDGLGGLSLRRIAEESETSTQMIYTIFGGKDALLEAVYGEGSRRLVERFQTVDADTPLLRLYQMGHEYRRYALENEALYESLFRSTASDSDIVRKTEVFDLFCEAIEDCFEAGLLTLRDPETITEAFWAAAHGAIGLELSGYYDSEDDARNAYDEVIRAVFDGFRVEDPTDINP